MAEGEGSAKRAGSMLSGVDGLPDRVPHSEATMRHVVFVPPLSRYRFIPPVIDQHLCPIEHNLPQQQDLASG